MDDNFIGKNIKRIRTQKGLSTTDLAKLTGISQSTISKLENGKRKADFEILCNIASSLNISLYSLTSDIKQLKDEVEIYDSINEDKSNVINIPIVGVIRAGRPILAQDNITGYLPTLKEFTDSDKNYFYLKVKGDSMNQEFKEGSLLLIEKTPCIENGQIGVVLIDGMDATVKKIVQNNNMITLIPMSTNPEYVPKMYDIQKDQVQVIGIVRQAVKIY